MKLSPLAVQFWCWITIVLVWECGCSHGKIGTASSKPTPEQRQKFKELTDKAGDLIALENFVAAQQPLREALKLNRRSFKVANDLAVTLLNAATPFLDKGTNLMVRKDNQHACRTPVCLHRA